VEPKNRLKPFLEHVRAFTEAQREIVPLLVNYFDFLKEDHEDELRKPHKERLHQMAHDAIEEREAEIKEALRVGDDETLKRIRGEMIRLVLDAKP
jgi:hypothetical protein